MTTLPLLYTDLIALAIALFGSGFAIGLMVARRAVREWLARQRQQTKVCLLWGVGKSLTPLLSLQKGATMRNPDRKNGKAWKKAPKVNRKTGKTVGGYSPAKLAERASKRKG